LVLTLKTGKLQRKADIHQNRQGIF